MAIAAVASRLESHRSRWIVANTWVAGLLVYIAAIALAPAKSAVWINDFAWTLSSLCGCLTAARTARRIKLEGRRAWWLIAAGCGSWCIGQVHWNYNQLVLGIVMPYPNLGQVFYSAFAVCIIAGILQLPEARRSAPLTLKHAGNVALVVCCLAAAAVLGLLEPLLRSEASLAYMAIGAMHSLLLAGTFLVALFALWTYQWSRTWTSMLLIVMATGVYSVSNLIYSYSLLTNTYVVSDVINGSWCAVFGLIAWAAHERLWLEEHQGVEPPHRMLARERWLEAIIPALLIVIMVGVAIATPNNLSSRALGIAAVAFVLFAIILGMREAWIQKEAQRLNDELVQANRQLAIANEHLRNSENRHRELNAQLEQRVSQRSAELGRAYGEIEGFAYAVAHDLKAPLRSLNSFAHLLHEHLGADATSEVQSRLERIRKGSLKMATLIDDLLAYSHIERRHLLMSEVEIGAIVSSILAQCADEIQSRAVAVQLRIPELSISVDADGLTLVLRNLIQNALKYGHGVERPTLLISVQQQGEMVVIEIADNGIGFDMRYHDQIFKIVQRLHRDDEYPGTGIGLALVRKAVQRMNGRVWAQSESGRGATFFVELPI
ncbi:MAG TPA: ATP-binding protein, partial [Steroidobacteraceae bacterium]|nr:ATP-binding protein [Steroidobacteraceae bacterium]